MNAALPAALAALVAYLLGSIPFGWLVGLAHGVDIRRAGSGNIGATNVLRVLGKKPGAFVFALDAAKGVAAVSLVPAAFAAAGAPLPAAAAVACAAAVVLGHSFPVFLGFKGGKGVATGLGIAVALVPHAALFAFALWLALFLATRYVSVASVAAAAFVAVAPWFLDPEAGRVALCAVSLLAALVVLKHRSNLLRLARGTENRFAFTARQKEALRRNADPPAR